MSIPNYLSALANHKGPAQVKVGNMTIPVKLMDISHQNNPYSGDHCTFSCLVVNEDQIQCEPRTPADEMREYVKMCLNQFHGAAGFNRKPDTDKKSGSIYSLMPSKVYFNDPVTVVIWADGTKTIVRCQEGDTYSKETGLALCFAKKALGNKGNFNDTFKRFIPKDEKDDVVNEEPETPEVKDECLDEVPEV